MSNSFYDDASLVVIPSGYKASKVYSQKPTDGTGDLVFTRSLDTATRVGADGLIEKVRTNLLTQSQNFTSGWSGAGITATANFGAAPDGTTTSTRLVFSGAAQIWQKPVTGATGIGVFSLFIKGTAGETIQIAYGGVIDKLITLGTGWNRFNTDGNVASTTAMFINTFGGATARTIEVWGGQVELGDIATPYIPTTTAAVSVGMLANVPRLDYLNSSCPRLLLEPQGTNLYPFSEQLNQWSAIGSPTVTANYAVSPDGFTNADRVQFIAGNALFRSGTGSAGQNTLSVYAKATNGTSADFRFFGNGATIFSSNQTATGEFQRFTFTYTFASTTAGLAAPTSGTGATDVIFYGLQHEVGSYATSYIPTLGAAVTRSADAASKTGISALIGQTEGTIFVDFVMSNNSTDMVPFDIAGSDGKLIWIRNTGAQFYGNGTTLIANIGIGAATQGTRYKVAFVYGQNDFRLYRNGSLIGTNTSGTFTGTFSNISLNAVINQANLFNQVLIFKTKLTNAQLAELTA